MNGSITLNDILSLPNQILETAKTHNQYCELLSDFTIHEYYYRGLKADVNRLFMRFNDAKYSYRFSISTYAKSNFSMNSVRIGRKMDMVGHLVEKRIDDYAWLEQFYYSLSHLATTLTEEEAVYLKEMFFEHESEEKISVHLNMCRTTLQKIKKSCLVKVLLEFQYLKKDA